MLTPAWPASSQDIDRHEDDERQHELASVDQVLIRGTAGEVQRQHSQDDAHRVEEERDDGTHPVPLHFS